MNKLHRAAAVTALRKQLLKRGGAMVRIDDERLHACRDEMIEREGDERFLKDRNERLRQIFRQRAEPRPQPGAENKGLRDHAAGEYRGRARLCRAAPVQGSTESRPTNACATVASLDKT